MKANWQDVTGGAILCAVGLVAGWMAADLRIGTARDMGPGYFPMMAAAIIVLTGMVIAGVGLVSAPLRVPRPDWGPMGRVLLAGGVFAALIATFGLLPAVAGTILLPSLFDWRLRPMAAVAMAALFCAASWLIFIVILGLPIPVWSFPQWI